MEKKTSSSEWKAVTYRNKQFPYNIQGEGTAILLVPPPGMGYMVFDKFDSLAENYCLIRPDFLGWEATVLHPGESMIQLYSILLEKILDQEEIKQAVITGYSAGGTIAQSFSLLYRERTKAVILLGGYPCVATKGLIFQYNTGLFFLKLNPKSVIHFLGAAHARRKSFKMKLENKMSQLHKDGVYRFFKESYYIDFTNFFPDFQVPFLTVYGKNEGWISKHRSYFDILPFHRTVSIENSIHQHPVRKPNILMHIIDSFIKKHLS